MLSQLFICCSVKLNGEQDRLIIMLTFLKLNLFKDPYIQVRKQAREERNHAIRNFNNKHESEYRSILQQKVSLVARSGLMQIVKLLNEGQVSSVQLVLIYARRIEDLALQKNYVAGTLLEQAYQRANECDCVRRENPLKKNRLWGLSEQGFPPLFGVPISVKDLLHVKGMPTTAGCSVKLRPQQEDSFIVKVLLKEGAIILVRGTTSLIGRSIQCASQLWGRAVHPFDSKRSTGGSSGGDAGMVAIGCVAAGIGNDLGGSLRLPAEFCGLTTIKSTSFRVQSKGFTKNPIVSEVAEASQLKGVSGPLVRCTEDAAFFFRSMVGWNPEQFTFGEYQPYVPRLPFREEIYFSSHKLKVGVLWDGLKVLPANESAQRAVRMAALHLQSKGHQIVSVEDLPQAFEAYKINVQLVIGMGKKGFLRPLEGEGIIPEWQSVLGFMSLPSLLRNLLVRLIPDYRIRETMEGTGSLSCEGYLTAVARIQKLRAQVAKLFAQFDVLLMPNANVAPFLHTTSRDLLISSVAVMLWNVLQYPAGCLPLTRISAQQQGYKRGSHRVDKMIDQNLKEAQGHLVSVQVVGRPNQEELILRVMRELEQIQAL